tara:strand:- start:32 stop:178 length:147 start_codon:yes stop_codon:yes gene_type:complete
MVCAGLGLFTGWSGAGAGLERGWGDRPDFCESLKGGGVLETDPTFVSP